MPLYSGELHPPSRRALAADGRPPPRPSLQGRAQGTAADGHCGKCGVAAARVGAQLRVGACSPCLRVGEVGAGVETRKTSSKSRDSAEYFLSVT